MGCGVRASKGVGADGLALRGIEVAMRVAAFSFVRPSIVMDDDSSKDDAPPEDERPFVRPGPANVNYYTVYCPTREEYRGSHLCETVCADTNWSDDKAREHRKGCPVFQKLLDEDMI